MEASKPDVTRCYFAEYLSKQLEGQPKFPAGKEETPPPEHAQSHDTIGVQGGADHWDYFSKQSPKSLWCMLALTAHI